MAFNKGLPKKVVAPVITEEPAAVVAAPVITDDDLLSTAVGEDIPVTEAAVTTAVSTPTPAAEGIYMTAADLAKLVTSVSAAGNQGIADAIAKALAGVMPQRKLTVAEMGEPKTPFNPEGRKRELKHDFFQNGFPIQERYVSDGEIELLHQLVPGSYGTPDFPIAVVEKKRLNGKTRIFILHADGKDDRLRIKNYAVTFTVLLQKLVQEAKDQRAQRRAEARALLADE